MARIVRRGVVIGRGIGVGVGVGSFCRTSTMRSHVSIPSTRSRSQHSKVIRGMNSEYAEKRREMSKERESGGERER